MGKVDTPMLTMEVKDMEFPRVLKKKHMKMPGLIKKEVQFPRGNT